MAHTTNWLADPDDDGRRWTTGGIQISAQNIILTLRTINDTIGIF